MNRQMVGEAGLELEPLCGRERSESPRAESLSAVEGPCSLWWATRDSNLSRYAGVSEAGALQAKS